MKMKDEINARNALAEEVAKEIRMLMAKHNIKWTDVADIVGVKRSSIYSKKDQNRWTLEDLVKLSRYFREPIVIGGRYAK